MFYENHYAFETFTDVVAELEEDDMIAESLADNIAVILQNHGLLTTGKSVGAAVTNFWLVESCCESQLLARAAGELKSIPLTLPLKQKR